MGRHMTGNGDLNTGVLNVLSDRRFGRFFLAAVDQATLIRRRTLTVHASAETLSIQQEQDLQSAIAGVDRFLRIRVKRYSLQTLAAPRSIESFHGPFEHDKIVSDPTGAFERAKDLLVFTRHLRVRFGNDIGEIFWRSASGELFLDLSKSDSRRDTGSAEKILASAERLLADHLAVSTSRYIKSLNVVGRRPSGELTPVDEQSVVHDHPLRGVAAAAGKLASISALVGFGWAIPANAKASAIDELHIVLPGISALPGLTSLGDDAFGTRASPRAFGGIRIFFGNSEPQLLAKCGLLYNFAPCPPRAPFESEGDSDRRSDRPSGYAI